MNDNKTPPQEEEERPLENEEVIASPLAQEQETIVEKSPREEELEGRIKELEDSHLRVRADFENSKKRLEREKFQALEYAYEKFARDLLPIIDTLEIALKSTQERTEQESEIDKKFREGIELTLENFYKALQKHGVEIVPPEGEFDPHLHECIMQIPSQDHQEGEIVQVFQKGYRYKERILRPAMVSVCKQS